MKTAAKAIFEALKVAGEFLATKDDSTSKRIGKVLIYVAVGLTLATQLIPSCDIKPLPDSLQQEVQHE